MENQKIIKDNKNKGGENMKYGITSGESKIALAILENTRVDGVPSEYLLFSIESLKGRKILPKRVNAKLTKRFLVNRGILKEEDGKIFLTNIGKELLSQ